MHDDGDGERGLTVTEAALHLGISSEAVRKRLQRRSLKGYKVGGKDYVLLPDEDGQRPDSVRTGVPTASSRELIAQLRSENKFLREQLRRADALLHESLTQTRHLLPPPQEETPKRGWWFWRR